MKRIFILLFAITAMQFGSFARENKGGEGDYSFTKDIIYTSYSDAYAQERCHLDVYAPKDAKDAPVMVWFHGGGLIGGNRYVPEEMKNQGIVVVSVNYRFMNVATIADCIDDAAAAVAWTFANIRDYGGDPKQIYVCGHSAGGYLTSMIGLEKKWLKKYGVDADDIAALMPLSGQAITHYELRKQKGGHPLKPGIDEFAPISHMRADCPPLFIMSGDRELELYGRYEEQAYFWRMMKLNGHKEVYLYEFQGYDHGAMPHPAFPILVRYIKQKAAKK